MSEQRRFLSFDFGAESGRVMLGTLVEGRLLLEEIHRFPNEPVEVCDTLHWDVLSLYNNVLKGMREYVRRFGDSVDGIGIDTWGVDFGLLDKDGKLLQNPVHYRDRRTDGMVEEGLKRITPDALYERTGLAIHQIHTLFQLFSLRRKQPALLDSVGSLLMTPNLLGYFLTGEKRGERTMAITSQLYDPRSAEWSDKVFKTFDLPMNIMPPLENPGTVLGELRESVRKSTGLKKAVVYSPCTHDTGSAVAAVPAQGDDWAFLSSGTWSILGALTNEVVTTPEAFAARACNELTLQSLFLARNIMGLWLLQQSRVAWQRSGQSCSYEDLVNLAKQAPQGGPIVCPDDPSFLAPDDMSQAIQQFCLKTGQSAPKGIAEISRCVLESLALSYRQALDQFSEILNRQFRVLHIVGGGSLNSLLCQFSANATGIAVLAGPVEATVMGNVLTQAYASGALASPAEIRTVVRNSAQLASYEPTDKTYWEDRYQKSWSWSIERHEM